MHSFATTSELLHLPEWLGEAHQIVEVVTAMVRVRARVRARVTAIMTVMAGQGQW